MKCRHVFLAVVMGFLGLQSQAQATVTVFNDKAAFVAATGATSATGPLPNLGLIPRNIRVTVGTVTFSTPSREMFIGDTRGLGIDWSLLLPGNDIAISESENLNVEFGSSTFAFGFDFHEPSNPSQAPFACSSSFPCVDSTFQVTLIDGAISVGSFLFNAPDDVAAFVGVQSDIAFNRVEIREISGGLDDEYFGQFYTGGPEFTINVTTFIPSNYVKGPPQSLCVNKFLHPPQVKQLYFTGDDRTFSPTATSFRTRQLVTVIPEEILDQDGFKDGTGFNRTGVTSAYTEDAILFTTPGRIDQADYDGIPNDCYLWEESSQASTQDMTILVFRINAHTVRAHLFGHAGDPLVTPRCDIDWDFTIDIDTSGQQPVWSLHGSHDAFPAFEIYINDHPIYTYNPSGSGFLALIQLCGKGFWQFVNDTGSLP